MRCRFDLFPLLEKLQEYVLCNVLCIFRRQALHQSLLRSRIRRILQHVWDKILRNLLTEKSLDEFFLLFRGAYRFLYTFCFGMYFSPY